ncbi:5'/3'-nucleotidase SurE [Nitrospirillum pindoramense]|uniref:5'-nucleotidase SurE n=1 Tax=Nitrospirillum amazonense TaxID=28077 RepID=A0A560HFP4_9PROT|nr:5'/3'-nucleotidase SurE [Nitrospirillum amazonense]TWB44170.1 5'-nucleotidase /3'-nucleotidase /exopolyphosphatase [Nitrospirillum amazonense]
MPLSSASPRRLGRVLLTNDDGINAPGLALLAERVAEVADEVWVVAPEKDQSGMSRAVTLTAPLRVEERGARRYALTGTPSDCAIFGLRHLLKDAPPDIVLSGINRGANVGDEVPYSGTVAAALTARLLGVPAMAFSLALTDRAHVRWDTARALLPRVLDHALGLRVAANAVLNINFPDLDPSDVGDIVVTRQSRGTLDRIDVEARTDMRGGTYHWMAFRRHMPILGPDTDAGALKHGLVSITPIGFDMTAPDGIA